MPPIPETASVPSTCSASSLRSVEPKCSCPSNQSPVKPRPSAASKILAQRRSKRRRDHQRLLSKLRTIIPRIVQTTSIDPKVTQGSRRAAPGRRTTPKSPKAVGATASQLPGRAPQSPKAAGAKRRGRRQDQGPQQPRAPISAQRPQPTTAPSQAARSSVTAGGGRA